MKITVFKVCGQGRPYERVIEPGRPRIAGRGDIIGRGSEDLGPLAKRILREAGIEQ